MARLHIGSDHAAIDLRQELAAAAIADGHTSSASRPERDRRLGRLPRRRRPGVRARPRRPRHPRRAGVRHRSGHGDRRQQARRASAPPSCSTASAPAWPASTTTPTSCASAPACAARASPAAAPNLSRRRIRGWSPRPASRQDRRIGGLAACSVRSAAARTSRCSTPATAATGWRSAAAAPAPTAPTASPPTSASRPASRSCVKRNGGKQAFDRLKLLAGLKLACRKRPVEEEQLETIVAAVELWAATRGEREIQAEEIGERIMQHLHVLDPVAYVRFVSVYRSFDSVQAFAHLLNEMEKAAQANPEGQRTLFEIDARGIIQLTSAPRPRTTSRARVRRDDADAMGAGRWPLRWPLRSAELAAAGADRRPRSQDMSHGRRRAGAARGERPRAPYGSRRRPRRRFMAAPRASPAPAPARPTRTPASARSSCRPGASSEPATARPPGARTRRCSALAMAGARPAAPPSTSPSSPARTTAARPPCTDALIAAGVAEVVFSVRDPARHAAGRASAVLAAAGVRVREGVAEALGVGVHEHYLHHERSAALRHPQGRDLARRPHRRPRRRQQVDHRRARAPRRPLAARPSPRDRRRRRHRPARRPTPRRPPRPRRRPAARHRRQPPALRPRRPRGRSACGPGAIVLHTEHAPEDRRRRLTDAGLQLLELPADPHDRVAIPQALDLLGRLSIRSLLVEGGGRLIASFVAAAAWDRWYWFQAPCLLGDGTPVLPGLTWPTVAQSPRLRVELRIGVGDDDLRVLRPTP
jgi:transcriptional regulator NrdR family protein